MGTTQTPDFEQLGALARQAQQGNGAAYEDLLEQLYGYVRYILLARLGYSSEVDDLTQTCLLAMHRSLPTYHPSRNLRPWVQAIIRYKLADYFRAQSRCREFAQAEEILEIEHQAHADREQSAGMAEEVNISVLLAKLPGDWAKAVQLTKLEGLSCEEAAKQEGVSAVALRKRVSRAYRKLAALIESERES